MEDEFKIINNILDLIINVLVGISGVISNNVICFSLEK